MILKSIFYLTSVIIVLSVLSILFLPKAVTVTRQLNLNSTPAKVFPIISSNKGFQLFNPYKHADAELKVAFSGPDNGVGSSFSFSGKEGKGKQTITALQTNESVTSEIDLGAMGKPIQTFQLTPTATGTQMTWATTMNFGYNPIGRIMGLFMDNMLGKRYEQGMELLNQHLQQNAQASS